LRNEKASWLPIALTRYALTNDMQMIVTKEYWQPRKTTYVVLGRSERAVCLRVAGILGKGK